MSLQGTAPCITGQLLSPSCTVGLVVFESGGCPLWAFRRFSEELVDRDCGTNFAITFHCCDGSANKNKKGPCQSLAEAGAEAGCSKLS
jgi:hypothetical protein